MTDVGSEALDLLEVGEVATRLRLSKATIWRLIYADEKKPGTGLKSVKVGRSRRVAPEDLIAFKDKLREQSSAPAAEVALCLSPQNREKNRRHRRSR